MSNRKLFIVYAGVKTGVATGRVVIETIYRIDRDADILVLGSVSRFDGTEALVLSRTLTAGVAFGQRVDVTALPIPDALVVLAEGGRLRDVAGGGLELLRRVRDAGVPVFVLDDPSDIAAFRVWIRRRFGVVEVKDVDEVFPMGDKDFADEMVKAAESNRRDRRRASTEFRKALMTSVAEAASAAAAERADRIQAAREAFVANGGELIETAAGVLARDPEGETLTMDEIVAKAASLVEELGAIAVLVGGAVILRSDIRTGKDSAGNTVAVLAKGSLSELSLKIALGRVRDDEAVRAELYRQFVDLRNELREFRTVGISGISAPLAGLRGFSQDALHAMESDPTVARQHVVDVGLGVARAKELARAAGFASVEAFISVLDAGEVGLLLAREPMTGAHRTHLPVRLRVVDTVGATSPIFVAPSVMKALFGDQDGDDVVLYLVTDRQPHKGAVTLGRVPMVKLFGITTPSVIDPIAAGIDIGLGAIASGRFKIKQLTGVRALAGADAKLLVSAWMTGCNAMVILADNLLGPEAATELYDLLAPMTEEIMDAGKETSGGAAGVDLGLPFAPSIVRLISVRDAFEFEDILRDVAEGVLGFFGAKAQPLAQRLARAADIMNDVANALADEQGRTDALAPLVENDLPTSYLVAGTVYHAVPDMEMMEPARLVGGEASNAVEYLRSGADLNQNNSGVMVNIEQLGDAGLAQMVGMMIQEPQAAGELPRMKFDATVVNVGSFEELGVPVPADILQRFRRGAPSVQLVEIRSGDEFRFVLVVSKLEQISERQRANVVTALFATEPLRIVRVGRGDQPMAVLVSGVTRRIVVGLIEPTVDAGVFVSPVRRIEMALRRAIDASIEKAEALRRWMERDGGCASWLDGHARMLANTVRAAWHDFLSRHSQPVRNGDGLANRALTIEISEPWRHAIAQGSVTMKVGKARLPVRLPAHLGYSAVLEAAQKVVPEGSWLLPAKKGSSPLVVVNPASVEDMEALGATAVAQNMRRMAREFMAEKAVDIVLADSGRRVRRVPLRLVIGSVPGVTGTADGQLPLPGMESDAESTEGILLSRLPGELVIRRSIQIQEGDDLGRQLLLELADRGPEFHLATVDIDGNLVPIDFTVENELLQRAADGTLTLDDLAEAGVDLSVTEQSLAPDVVTRSAVVTIVAVTDRINAVKMYVTDGMIKGMAVVTGAEMTADTPDGRVRIDGIVGADAVKSKTSVGTVLFGLARLFGLDTEMMNMRMADAWAADVLHGDTVEHRGYHQELRDIAAEMLEAIRVLHPNWVDETTGDVRPVAVQINGRPAGAGLLVEVMVSFDDDTDLTRGRSVREGVGLPLRDQVVLKGLAALGRLHPAANGLLLPLKPTPDRAALAKLLAIHYILHQEPGEPRGDAGPAKPTTGPKAPVDPQKTMAATLVESLASLRIRPIDSEPAPSQPQPPAQQPDQEALEPVQQPEQRPESMPDSPKPRATAPAPDAEEPVVRRAHFDGGASGNPGPAGCAAVLYENGREVACASKHFASATNNEMEWRGAIAAIRLARHLGWRQFQLVGDSQLVIDQLKGAKKVKAANLVPLYREAVRLLTAPDWRPLVEFVWVPREQNARANELAQSAEHGPDHEVRRLPRG